MSELLTEVRDGVLVVTINRPQAKNAVNGAVAEGIAAAMDELDSNPDLRVGVLTGAGGVFCAGMDLKAFVAGETPMLPGRGFGGLTEAPPKKPLIAAVEGWALAGGFELALACDMIVASSAAKFGVPEVKRGLFAAGGGVVVLHKRIPRALAMEMVLTGDPITAERAAEIGLVNRIVEPEIALDGALALAATIAANGPLSVAVSKELITRSADMSIAEAWEDQNSYFDKVFNSEDAKEGATAFAEKRAPEWKGR
ncbi:MAG: crotonase/enoyl-CoA hydratase family protein [Dermatophilus congolensis]|nr:crotonase/enoyl-CoA hydratase family protein [Dermatophilus congolensis]